MESAMVTKPARGGRYDSCVMYGVTVVGVSRTMRRRYIHGHYIRITPHRVFIGTCEKNIGHARHCDGPSP